MPRSEVSRPFSITMASTLSRRAPATVMLESRIEAARICFDYLNKVVA